MGPLIPFEIISQEWGLLIIFLIGIAFGMILEQSGFSSSKKLVGVFYAYDFVVLKVFFTAGITAMTGLFFMSWFGWIDTQVVFINANFLLTALVGGVIMGLGFLFGGFCPGTSLTAAAIGKIDAMVFILGMFIGIFFFGLFFDVFSRLQTGLYFDRTTITELLGITPNLFIAGMILMALVAFGVGTYFEKKAPAELKPTNKAYNNYFPEITIAVVIIIVLLIIPEKNPKGIFEKSEKYLHERILEQDYLVETEELAYHLMKNTGDFQIVDVRNREDFLGFHFEGAIHMPLNNIPHKNTADVLRVHKGKRLLFVSNGGVDATKAWMLSQRRGIDNVYVLNGGLNKFVGDIFFDNDKVVTQKDYLNEGKYRFRKEAAQYFMGLKN